MRNIVDILRQRAHMAQCYKKIFNTPEGEVVLEHLMRMAGILHPKILANEKLLLVREGQRHIVLSILRTLGKDIPELKELIKESLQNEEPVEQQSDGG